MHPLSNAEVAVDESSDEEDIVEKREGNSESEQDISIAVSIISLAKMAYKMEQTHET